MRRRMIFSYQSGNYGNGIPHDLGLVVTRRDTRESPPAAVTVIEEVTRGPAPAFFSSIAWLGMIGYYEWAFS